MNIDQHESRLSEYVYCHTVQNRDYQQRCREFIATQHEIEDPARACELLCEGELPFYYAPFYIAWEMGLLPGKCGHACDDTPVFYDIPRSGYDKLPEDTQDFVNLMVGLLTHPVISREATSMLIEFHDFLAVRDQQQAKRFLMDIVTEYAFRHGDVRALLCTRGESERLRDSEAYPEAMREALHATGWLNKGIGLLSASSMAQAYRRLKWPEMTQHANEAGIEATLGVDLGL